MTNTQIGLAAIGLFLAVILTCLALIPADHADEQQAMTDEWLTFLDTLPVLKEDPR